MDMVTVSLGFKSMLLNSLLIAVLPVAVMLGADLLISKSLSLKSVLVGGVLYALLQGYLVFQAGGKVYVNKGVLHVRSGFYSASWPIEGLKVQTIDREAMDRSVRLNGIATYGFRAGWFRLEGRKVFFLTTGERKACIQEKGTTVLCVDSDVAASLKALAS
ncbi:hypothetical protein [Pseudomonas sp. zfem005]|uniref:hypothetical protein n=1 Tax=Pseudomonas sp. zfem005 TaxID=3078200 RepID=UPI00292A26F7|nr:hypothetical protein [Pseudomonas sp. zfem005]MDU9414064.1 hypothetical protein [Pseudomonas sp. zfem005]